MALPDPVELGCGPTFDKRSRLQAGLAASSVDQCFGTYEGRIVPHDGPPLEVTGLLGWAEEATWRW